MTKIETALNLAVDIANDNSHGYSQINRNGPDYDCSSLVINCLKRAGIDTGNATYTGNMKSELTKNGFVAIPYKKGLELVRGDILLNEKHHTLFYLGNGKIVQASISETGGITGKTGDQTGKEIAIGPFYIYSKGWDYILRYQEREAIKVNVEMTQIQLGSNCPEVGTLQTLLKALGFKAQSGRDLTVDRDFGKNTDYAVRLYQKSVDLTPDGIVGPKTWSLLLTKAIY